ncbi:MAG: translation initiation factor eIF-2B subunit delta [Halobacteriales archaeon]|jgi:translation initiation factor eIF-2B subunit delta
MIDETIEEISEMQTHSSSVVAIKAADALRELLDRDFATVEEYERTLERNGSALRRANVSHASLQNAVREVVAVVSDGEFESVPDAKAATEETIDSVIDRIEAGKHRAAEHAAAWLEDGSTILTHDYSSTVLEAIDIAASDGTYLEVYVTEARPRYLGRKTVRTLAEMDRVDANLIVDSASGYYLDECDAVVVGMDCIVEDTLFNRVGTSPIAASAAEAEVPFVVVGSSAKIVDGGFVFENEFRSPSEVMREPPDGFSVENPAYDATPLSLVDSLITDEGRRSA